MVGGISNGMIYNRLAVKSIPIIFQAFFADVKKKEDGSPYRISV